MGEGLARAHGADRVQLVVRMRAARQLLVPLKPGALSLGASGVGYVTAVSG